VRKPFTTPFFPRITVPAFNHQKELRAGTGENFSGKLSMKHGASSVFPKETGQGARRPALMCSTLVLWSSLQLACTPFLAYTSKILL
jgi:hypothetical protein